MSSDWHLKRYSLILDSVLKSKYTVQTVSEYIDNPCEAAIILRHDIDRFPTNAVKMAELEHSKGIKSTYYSRMTNSVFKPELIRKISSLGHEIGYHYETLTKSKGKKSLAIELFENELLKLRGISDVTSAAAHGSPLSAHDNRSIINQTLLNRTNLKGEAYYSINYNIVSYYTDTGRAWDANDFNIRDRVNSESQAPQAKELHDLIQIIESNKLTSICIQTHPERWAFNTATLIRSYFFDQVTNLLKSLLNQGRSDE